MNPAVVIVTSSIVHVLTLVGLWLRLRWRTRQQRVHRGYLLDLIRALPLGSCLDDDHGGGRRTRLIIGPDTE